MWDLPFVCCNCPGEEHGAYRNFFGIFSQCSVVKLARVARSARKPCLQTPPFFGKTIAMAATTLILHLSRAKLGRVERRAAELGRDASGYIAGLINHDLKQAARARLYDSASARDSMKVIQVTPRRSR